MAVRRLRVLAVGLAVVQFVHRLAMLVVVDRLAVMWRGAVVDRRVIQRRVVVAVEEALVEDRHRRTKTANRERQKCRCNCKHWVTVSVQ